MGTRIPCYKLYREVQFRRRNGKPTDMKCNMKYQTGEGKQWKEAESFEKEGDTQQRTK